MEIEVIRNTINFKDSSWICLGCRGRDAAPFIINGADHMRISSRRYNLYRCQKCLAVFLYPQTTLEEQTDSYDRNYVPYQPYLSGGKMHRALYWRGVNKQVKVIQAFMESGKGKALDIGCGGGDFLSNLQSKGWQVEGVELSPEISAIAQSKYNIKIHVGNYISLPLPENTFDLVTFWDVLEHLENPRDAIRKAYRITKLGGTLVFSLPNPESFEAKLFGKSWAGWDIPRHLWIFSKAVWAQILNEEGWEVVRVKHMRGRHWLFNLSLEWWLQDRSNISIWHKLLKMVVKSPLGLIGLWPYFEYVEKTGQGAIMVFFARKREGASVD